MYFRTSISPWGWPAGVMACKVLVSPVTFSLPIQGPATSSAAAAACAGPGQGRCQHSGAPCGGGAPPAGAGEAALRVAAARLDHGAAPCARLPAVPPQPARPRSQHLHTKVRALKISRRALAMQACLPSDFPGMRASRLVFDTALSDHTLWLRLI